MDDLCSERGDGRLLCLLCVVWGNVMGTGQIGAFGGGGGGGIGGRSLAVVGNDGVRPGLQTKRR